MSEEKRPARARVGRELQRWDGEARLVAGCVPFRRGSQDGVARVLMVENSKKTRRIFPKGGWEEDERTPEEAARREAFEEAGVKGGDAVPLGDGIDFVSGKGRPTRLHAFLLRVERVLEEYPESADRAREWLSLPDARRAAGARPEMVEMLRRAEEALDKLGW